MQFVKWLILIGFLAKSGAPTEKCLEHIDTIKLIENLEDWEAYLKAEPTLAYHLRLLDEERQNELSQHKESSPQKPRGPRP
ncbi:MAG: hypothetical protein OIF51_08810 [Cellvibrionaceae bacterium]|nr:hypothetical protein [Cellvibrionaceae bacterium]